MAQIAPPSIDVTDIQFKLQSKVKLFNVHESVESLNSHNILAAASSHGLVFSGSSSSDLRVIQLSTLAEGPTQGTPVATRIVPLPSKTSQIAVNCDHSLVAVDVTKNGLSFIQIYSVPSFYANDVTLTHEFQIQGSCHSSQLLWNPVSNNVLAIVTEKGGLVIYTLKSPGMELCSLDGQEFVQSACWSPKGKQIVAGFANGKLIQFKPDLKPARTIPCPENLLEGGFDTIAIQWLATYQFAAVFQSRAEDTTPALFIVNAPKTEAPRYINYDDICYSQSGPRKPQVFLSHILPWNLLIVASANSMEVGVLGTTEQGDFPMWKQFVPAELRAELPLTASKQETFPMGMSLEVGVTHKVTIGETEYPIMPMIHLLSTDGLLISFNLLNTMPNTPGICCPPNPIRNNSGLVYFKVPDLNVATTPAKTAPASDITFTLGNKNATSTPAPVKSLFGNANEPPKSAANLFGAPSSTGFTFGGGLSSNQAVTTTTTSEKPPPAFGSLTQTVGTKPPSFGFGAQPVALRPIQSVDHRSSGPSFGQTLSSVTSSTENKPLITVPPTYTAATKPQSTKVGATVTNISPTLVPDQADDVKIDQAMIREEIQNFHKDLRDLIARSRAIQINIGTKDESHDMAKQLNELSKLNKEATEINDSLTSDVNALRINLHETFAMVAETKNKNRLYKSQDHLQMEGQYSMSQTNKRQLQRLENMLKVNEAQLFMVTRQVDAQWADYQDMQKLQNKTTMKIPSLEGVYQTISKQRDILAKHRMTLNKLKNQLGMRDTVKALESSKQDPVESLTDSILSMSIIDQVQQENEKLNARKLKILKDCLKRHKTQIIKPNRPERLGINSEVVQEKREQMKKKLRADKKVQVPKPKEQKQFMPPVSQTIPKLESQQKPQKTEIHKAPVTQNAKPTTLPTFAPTNVPMSKPIAQKPPTQPSTGFAFIESASMTQTEAPKFSFAQLTPQAPPAVFGTVTTSKNATMPTITSTMPFSTSAQKIGGEKSELPKPIFATETTKPGNAQTSGFSFGGTLNLNKPETKSGGPLLFGTTTITPVTKPTPAVVDEKAKEEPKPTISFSGSGGMFGESSTVTSTSFFGNFGQKQDKITPEEKVEKPAEVPKSPLASLVETVANVPAPTETRIEKPVFLSKKEVEKEKSPEKGQLIKPTAQFSFGFGTTESITPTTTTVKSIFGGFTTPPTQSIAQTQLESSPKSTASLASTVESNSSDNKDTVEFSFSSAALNLEKVPETSMTSGFSVASTGNGLSLSFGGTTTTAATTKPGSIFSSITPLNTPNTTVTSSLFGNSGTGLFGSAASPPVTTSATASPLTTVALTTTPTTSASAEGLFSSFNICSPSSPPTNTATSQSATNIFGTSTGFGTSSQQPTTSIFGGASNTETKPSIFGSTIQPQSTTQPTFGSTMPKPDQSVFGNNGNKSMFGAAAAANTNTTSPFGQPQNTSSIFGGTATAPATASLFGGGAANSSTSMFGAKPVETQSSPFGQQQTSAFSTGGSLFGGNSTFGSGATGTTSGFGFGQQQAQQPVFGGGATFGSSPAFGSAFAKPSFGGAPTFGQKPLFGSPTQPTATAAVPTNNLFEQLGSQSTGMTFGNLAQSSPPQQQTLQQQPPPTFGGSAFSSWR